MKVRNFYLVIIFTLFFLDVKSQKQNGTEYIVNAGEYKLGFQNRKFLHNYKLPFKKVIVHDYRFDTSKIGYLEIGTGIHAYNKIKLRDDWSEILNTYFKSNLDTSSNLILHIAIKSFWMQEGIVDEITSKKIIQKSIGSKSDSYGNCKAQMDFFIQTGSDIKPFFQIDDVFLNGFKFKGKKLDEWFFLPFDSMAKKIIQTDILLLLSKKKTLSFEEVDSFYKKRFEIPVLSEASLKKGIFLTFNDFKINKSFSVDFKLNNGRLTDELYIINNGKQELITDYWGFYDGINLFIKAGFNAFAALPQQKTYEIFGGKHISNYHNNPSTGDIRIASMVLDRKILQLNMETGNFY